MKKLNSRFLLFQLTLVLLAVLACSWITPAPTEEADPPDSVDNSAQPAEEAVAADSGMTDGQALIVKMEEAIKAANGIELTMQFQMATSAGGVRGWINTWAERPSQLKVEVNSETADINGATLNIDDISGWIYSPYQQTFYFSQNYPGTPHLADQPELHQVVNYARQVWEQGGLGEIEATILGEEMVGSWMTTQVEVIPEQSIEMAQLDEVRLLLWIEQTDFLPRKIELQAQFGELTGKGRLTAKTLLLNPTLDPTIFQFEAPADADTIVVDLDAIQPIELTDEAQLVPNPE